MSLLVLFFACATKDPAPIETGNTCDDPAVEEVCTEDGQTELYARYIEPLVTGGQPSSCNQCHLSGVDLSMYVQDTPCQSMACMVEQGMVDLEDPANSAVLAQILMADPESELIDGDVIQREYDGFLEWITWSAGCQDCVCGEIEDPCNTGTSETPPTGVATPLGGSCTEDELAASFEVKVWPWRDRCSSCHTPEGSDQTEGAPAPWMASGADSDAALYTMYTVIGGDYIDTASPADSLWLTKPLAGVVDHGGGDKFHDTSDEAYIDFLGWIEEYSACYTAE